MILEIVVRFLGCFCQIINLYFLFSSDMIGKESNDFGQHLMYLKDLGCGALLSFLLDNSYHNVIDCYCSLYLS